MARRMVGEREMTMGAWTITETIEPLGELWVVTRAEGPGGEAPVRSMTTFGYDPALGKFVGSYVDTIQTRMWTYEGFLDESGTVLTFETEGPSMADPEGTTLYRDQYILEGADTKRIVTSAQDENGAWVQFAEMTGKRLASPRRRHPQGSIPGRTSRSRSATPTSRSRPRVPCGEHGDDVGRDDDRELPAEAAAHAGAFEPFAFLRDPPLVAVTRAPADVGHARGSRSLSSPRRRSVRRPTRRAGGRAGDASEVLALQVQAALGVDLALGVSFQWKDSMPRLEEPLARESVDALPGGLAISSRRTLAPEL